MEPEYVVLSQKIYAIEIDSIERLKRASIRPTIIDEFGSRMLKLMETEFGLSKSEFGYFVNGQDLPYNQIIPFAKKVEDRIYQELDTLLIKEKSKNKAIESDETEKEDQYSPNLWYKRKHHKRFRELWIEEKNQVRAYDRLVKEFPDVIKPDLFDSYIVRFRIWNKNENKKRK